MILWLLIVGFFSFSSQLFSFSSQIFFIDQQLYKNLAKGNFKHAKILVKYGANIYIRESSISDCFYKEIEEGEDILVNIIIKRRKEEAIYSNRIIKIIRFVMRNFDVDINIQNHLGNTWLHEVCLSYYGSKDKNFRKIARFLLRNGARFDIPNNENLTAYDIIFSAAAADSSKKLFQEKNVSGTTFPEALNLKLHKLATNKRKYILSENSISDIYSLIFYYFVLYDNEEESYELFFVCKNYYNLLLNMLSKPIYVKKLPTRQKYALYEKMVGEKNTRNFPRLK